MTVITMIRCFLRPWVSSTHTSTRNGLAGVCVGGCIHRTGVADGEARRRRPARNDRFVHMQRPRRAGNSWMLVEHGQPAGYLLFPRNRVFRHYIIHSFTQNIIVANMSLMSEISGPYCNHALAWCGFPDFALTIPGVHTRLSTDVDSPAGCLWSPEVANTFLLNESLSEETKLPRLLQLGSRAFSSTVSSWNRRFGSDKETAASMIKS